MPIASLFLFLKPSRAYELLEPRPLIRFPTQSPALSLEVNVRSFPRDSVTVFLGALVLLRGGTLTLKDISGVVTGNACPPRYGQITTHNVKLTSSGGA